MGCCGDREKLGELRAEQKWDYINLDEFKSESCLTPLSYGVLFISLIISISVYAVDTFTAINLLAFDRWSGQISPAIPFTVSRWIFAGCIICSFVLLFYRWLRAVRVMRQGGVAQSYLDPLAVRIQSIRMGKNGRGWKRFLVFAELTKGKKGTDYVALFTYFSFEAWLRVVFAEGPRQVVNALTLYSVMKLKLIPTGDHAAKNGHSSVAQFFVNVEALADSDQKQAVVFFGMLFTLVVWVISIINLALAVLLYIFFLFHHIPSADGSLSKYCRRKINQRMEKIVQAKVLKNLKKENAMRARQEAKGGKDGKRQQPTLPSIGIDAEEKEPDLPLLSRADTQSTLPLYQSEAGSSMFGDLSRHPTMPDVPDISGRPGAPTRTVTQASAKSSASYSSNAPLISSAGDIGYGGRSESPGPGPIGYGRSESPRPSSPANYAARAMPPGRSMTGSTQSSQYPYSGPPRPPTAQGRQTPGNYSMDPSRSMSGMSNSSIQSFQQQVPNSYQMGPIPRSGTAQSMAPPRPGTAQGMGPAPPMSRRTPGPSPMDGRNPPSFSNNPYMNYRAPPSSNSGRGTPVSQSSASVNGSYMPYNPAARPSTPQGGPQGMPHGPPRSFTQPNIAGNNYANSPMRPGQYPPRSGTAPPSQQQGDGGYDDILNSY